MRTIHQLPQIVISKIAAGEVIERPVYAVKELVENSLDAGADSIAISVEESGLQRIMVVDNGEGMSAEDLKECFKPHTTSKLDSADGLSHVQTLGFRGEALASIAAISRMTIASRQKNDTSGASVVLLEGRVEKTAPVGMPVGTSVTVENLFHAVPARKKFLKSLRTEFRHIIDTVMHFAFANPSVHFILTHNGKTILDVPKTDDVLSRVHALLGKDIFASLIPIEFEESYVKMTGFLAKPQITTKTPHKQFLFINKRKVHDKGISLEIKNAYGTLIDKQSYPVCIVFFEMPFETVDVNVHPRKEEVRFADSQGLLQMIEQAVTKTLAEHNLTFHTTAWEKAVFLGDSDARAFKSTASYAGKLLKEQKLPWNLDQIKKDAPIVQLHNLYLVTETADGFALIDQHAAHERIMYEQFTDAFTAQKEADHAMHLPKPYVLELSLSESEILEEYMEVLEQAGFAIEHFKGKSYIITAVPQLLHDRDYKTLLIELFEGFVEGRGKSIDSISQKMLAYLACHAAVRAGDALTEKQAKDLIQQLEKTPNNATCPHGRPTKIVMDIAMMNKLFKR